MPIELNRIASSPNGQYEATLEWVGEIRFGPAYYRLYIRGRVLSDRVFGSEFIWSPDSRFLLVQEWLTTSEAEGPNTMLVAFDVQHGRECALAKASHGFVDAIGVLDNVVRYRKSYYSEGKTIDYEQDFPPSELWVISRGLR